MSYGWHIALMSLLVYTTLKHPHKWSRII